MKDLFKFLIPATVGTKQNYNILISCFSKFPCFLIRYQIFFQQFLNSFRDCIGFTFLCGKFCIFLRFFHKQKLCIIIPIRILRQIRQKGRTKIKCRIVIIINTAQFLSHGLIKHIVCTIHNLPAASEVLMQVNTLLFSVGQSILVIFFHKNFRTRKKEFVNTLLYISYHKTVIISVIFPGNTL